MSELTLISAHKRPLKPLIQSALENELRFLDAGIRQGEKRVAEFEARYQIPTAEFIRKYENDEIQENLDFDDWIGEYRLLGRLKEKAETLQGVKILCFKRSRIM